MCLASPLCTDYDDDNNNIGSDNDDNIIIIINIIEFKFTIYTRKVFYSKWAILLFCSRKYMYIYFFNSSLKVEIQSVLTCWHMAAK